MVFDGILPCDLCDCSGRFMWRCLSVLLQSVLVDIYSLSCERLFLTSSQTHAKLPSAFCSHILTLQKTTRIFLQETTRIYSLAGGGCTANVLTFQEVDRRTSKEQHASRKLSVLLSDFNTKHNRCWPHRQAERTVCMVSQGWLVLRSWSLPKKTQFWEPSLPIGCRLQGPPSHVVHLDLRCHLQPYGRLWTLCWVLLPVVPPVFSLIPWRSSRPVCSYRENFGPGAPTRDTTEELCRRSGWWAVMMGCVACRRGSQSASSTRGWWTV